MLYKLFTLSELGFLSIAPERTTTSHPSHAAAERNSGAHWIRACGPVHN